MPTHPITPSPSSVAAFVGVASAGPLNAPVVITSFTDFTSNFGADGSPLATTVSLFFANGGQQACIVRVNGTDPADDAVSAPGLERRRRGLWALERTEGFNLLCVPRYNTDGADVSARTRRVAAALCRSHRAIYLADPLSAWTSADAVLSGLQSSEWGLTPDPNVGVYWPALTPAAGAAAAPAVDASSAVAGVIARTDTTLGVWQAPAGAAAAIAGAGGLTVNASAAEQERLNRAGVNVLKVLSGGSIAVWGARTLMGDDTLASEWKYLPVRRLALLLESSIVRSAAWTEPQPNAEPLWKELRLVVSAFLHDLFAAGAFRGRTDREAWFLKCDAGTTTAADIAAGRLHLVVGFAPLKPAEFIVLELMMKAAPA